jgi:hypothetical protein
MILKKGEENYQNLGFSVQFGGIGELSSGHAGGVGELPLLALLVDNSCPPIGRDLTSHFYEVLTL